MSRIYMRYFIFLVLFSSFIFIASAKTPIKERVRTIEDTRVETSLNLEAFRLAGSTDINIEYWMQVLPEMDKNRSKYIVIPSNGLVVPIISIPEGHEDYKKAINGEEFEYLDRLANGALEFPGVTNNKYGEAGNKVLFGHSSYWKKEPGRYKTHFQKIIELDVGEEVWIFEKQTNGEFVRSIYNVSVSKEVINSDVSILKHTDKKELTLVTCTPIGGISHRWVIKAHIKDDITKPVSYKSSIDTVVEKLKGKYTGNQRIVIFNKLIGKIEEILPKYEQNQMKKDILSYLKQKLEAELK